MDILKKLNIVVDVDDVLMDCNGYALRLLSAEDGVLYSVKDITGWGINGTPVDRRLKFFNERFFFETQQPFEGARRFLNELMKKGDVTIVTAIDPRFVGERMRRIAQLFPEFPLDHVILGSRKDRVTADVMIDDGLHNLLSAKVTLPVLFDQPWNRSVSGICRVSGYDEVLTLVNLISGRKVVEDRMPKVVCIVGPSGGRKHELADALCGRPEFKKVGTVTTAEERRTGGMNVSPERFEEMKSDGLFLENSYYSGDRYGVLKTDVDDVLTSGRNAVIVTDISGCLSAHLAYPGQCRILYLERDKRNCILSVISKPGLSPERMTDRIMSIDFEQKNAVLADCVIPDMEIPKQAEIAASFILGTKSE